MPRYFTLDEANRALSIVVPILRQIAAARCAHSEAESVIQTTVRRITVMGGSRFDPSPLVHARTRRDAAASRLGELIEELHTHGCLLKDLDQGLIDFPTLYRGEEVYLCFRLGEERIAYWHQISAGFRGRKAIDREFLDNHRGD